MAFIGFDSCTPTKRRLSRFGTSDCRGFSGLGTGNVTTNRNRLNPIQVDPFQVVYFEIGFCEDLMSLIVKCFTCILADNPNADDLFFRTLVSEMNHMVVVRSIHSVGRTSNSSENASKNSENR